VQKVSTQATLVALLAASGPVAKGLAKWMGYDQGTIDIILQFAQIATPLAAGLLMLAFNTVTSKIASILASSPEVQKRMAAALPTQVVAQAVSEQAVSRQTEVAHALANEAVISATAAIPEVAKVVVKDGAQNGAGKLAASADPSVAKVDFEKNQ